MTRVDKLMHEKRGLFECHSTVFSAFFSSIPLSLDICVETKTDLTKLAYEKFPITSFYKEKKSYSKFMETFSLGGSNPSGQS